MKLLCIDKIYICSKSKRKFIIVYIFVHIYLFLYLNVMNTHVCIQLCKTIYNARAASFQPISNFHWFHKSIKEKQFFLVRILINRFYNNININVCYFIYNCILFNDEFVKWKISLLNKNEINNLISSYSLSQTPIMK